MLSNSKFWYKTGAWLQLITGLIHGMSLFNKPQPQNETEQQLIELMSTYKMDMGAGFIRTMEQIFTSISAFMTLSLLFAAAVNFVLIKENLTERLYRKTALVNFIYGLLASLVFYFLAFLPPFVCLVLITLAFGCSFFLTKRA